MSPALPVVPGDIDLILLLFFQPCLSIGCCMLQCNFGSCFSLLTNSISATEQHRLELNSGRDVPFARHCLETSARTRLLQGAQRL